MRFLLPILTLLLGVLGIWQPEAKAQTAECGTDQYNRELLRQFPELAEQREQLQTQLRHYLNSQHNDPTAARSQTIKLIPVVVHLITETGGGGLTNQQIEQGITYMNDDFRKLNSDTTQVRPVFRNLIADSNIEFRLAKIDPQGNCTNGIVRIASPLTNDADPYNAIKDLSYWPADRYFNIWLVNSATVGSAGTVNGYAQYPGTGLLSTYGVVCRIDRFGLDYANGIRTRTLTHEVGHCLNLYHLHDYGCGTDCSYTGDEVCDTPPSSSGFFNCSSSANSCSNDTQGPSAFTTDVNDQFENYMFYGDCRLMFTHGQKARMLATIDTYWFLQNLTSPANAVATGIATPQPQVCAPVAHFSADKTQICAGATVAYTDYSFNATPDSTWTWSWSFPGAVPATSAQQNPTVQYPAAGVYPATLTVTNSAGTDSYTRTSYIDVWPATGDVAPYAERFETASFPAHATDPAKNWRVIASSDSTWARYTGTSAGGAASLRIRNSLIPYGTVNSIISPALDLSGITSPMLTFDVAYALSITSSNDQLKVYVSTNCGLSWTMRYSKTGITLNTMGSQQLPQLEPSTAAHWRTETVQLNGYNLPGVRVKFEATSRGGNSIFLDNINLSLVSGISELPATAFTLYPNPAGDQVLLQMNLPAAADISCRLTDVTGREVLSIMPGKREAGQLEIPMPLSSIAAGVYVVQVSDGHSVITRKLVKQ